MAIQAMLSFRTRLTVHFRDQFTCQYCRRLIHPLSEDLTIDHVVPKDGQETDNLATCCRACNVAKGAMTGEEFRRKLNGLQPTRGTEGATPLDDILESVAVEHRVKARLLVAKGNHPHMVRIRAKVARLARSQGYSLPAIAKLLNRHHTTVIHLLSKYGGLP